MEMKIIDVALSLIAIYLVLALVASQIREFLAGTDGPFVNWIGLKAFDSRRHFLEQMVTEAFGKDNSGLINRFFNYAPIFSLSQGQTRPSAIPPQLFASAFLAVLNPRRENTHPRLDYRTPSEFVTAFDGKEGEHLRDVLQLKLAGVETDWDKFEERLALWYADIGDRAGGWYKKNNAKWLFFISLALAASLNVDSFYLAKTLYEDDHLRTAVANIAELAATEAAQNTARASGTTATPATSLTPLPTSSEFVRTSQAVTEFDTALANIRAAIKHDTSIAGFGYDYNNLYKKCSTDLESEDKEETWFATNSDAWLILIPSIQEKLDQARFGVRFATGNKDQTGTSFHPTSASAPPPTPTGPVASTVKNAELMEQTERTRMLREVLVCASAVAVWVKAAQGDATTVNSKANLKSAGEALDKARMIVMEQLTLYSGQTRLAQMYRRNAKVFQDCADAAGSSRAEFDSCLKQTNLNNIPFGLPPELGQLCDVHFEHPNKQVPNKGVIGAFFCDDYEGSPELGLPPIKADFNLWKFAFALLGIVFTAILVSLGAPFWFDLLGKVVNLRLAGRARGLGETTVPPSSPAGGTPSPATTSAEPGKPSPSPATAAFDDARNEFEHNLRPRDISRLQIVLSIPPSGRLDQATRSAIGRVLKDMGEQSEEELSARSYEAIVGRPAPAVVARKQVPGTWYRGTDTPEVSKLVDALNRIFPKEKGWKLLDQTTTYSDDVRAKVVLYRYYTETKKDGAAETKKDETQMSIFVLAKNPRGELTQLDEKLRNAIIADQESVFAPSPEAPWMDYALGELGITEDGSTTQSDLRVVEYLKTLEADPVKGDGTPWCGAFVGWVLKQAGLLDKILGQADKSKLLSAANWKDIKQKVDNASAKRGDICVIKNKDNGQHHVAFFIKEDASHVWLLGGNQGPDESGAVTLAQFRLATNEIIAVQRPA